MSETTITASESTSLPDGGDRFWETGAAPDDNFTWLLGFIDQGLKAK